MRSNHEAILATVTAIVLQAYVAYGASTVATNEAWKGWGTVEWALIVGLILAIQALCVVVGIEAREFFATRTCPACGQRCPKSYDGTACRNLELVLGEVEALTDADLYDQV